MWIIATPDLKNFLPVTLSMENNILDGGNILSVQKHR
jgi:hypothetical protein